MSADSSWKRIVRAVWNGPFYIGKLVPPVSTGDAILKLLETLWRLIVLVIVVPAIGLALLFVWIEWITPVFFPPLKDQVSIYVRYDDGSVPMVTTTTGAKEKPFRCTKEDPIRVEFFNHSGKTIKLTNFTVEATERDHSTDLWNGVTMIDSDGVMPPNTGWRACYYANIVQGHDPANVDYKGEINFVKE